MKVHPVQGKSKADLERIAESHLQSFFPENLLSPRSLDVDKLLTIIDNTYGWSTDVRDVFPDDILGYCDPKSKSIVLSDETYSGLCNNDGRCRFTGVHEASHVILHRQEMKSWMISMTPTADKLFRVEKSDLKAYVDPEWQADFLAGAMLMPRVMVKKVYSDCFRNVELTINKMMELFNVSYTAAQIRLKKIM